MSGAVGVLFAVISFVCWLIVLIDAFNNSLWKGIFALLCGLYWLYYAVFEFAHEHKWAIVLLAILGGGASGLSLRAR